MHSRTTARSLRASAVALIAATALAMSGCAPSGDLAADGSKDSGSAKDAFTVGLLTPMTGFVAAVGTDMQQGWDLYWEEHGTKAGKFTVKTVMEDTASSADTGLSKAQRLVTEEHVDVVVGPVLANVSLAVGSYLAKAGVANLAQTAADDLTQRSQNPLVLRTGAYAGSQTTYPGGKWAFDEGYKTAATLCVDYAFGWENCGGFASAFTDAGGKVTKQYWYPADATDMSTYVSQLKSSGADMAFVATAGGPDSSNFLRSASDFGLLKSMPILNNCCATDQAILQDVGDIAVGVKSVHYYAEGTELAATKKFVKNFEKKYNVIPSSYAMGMYATADMLAKALEKASKKLTGTALVDAIKQVDLSGSVYGDVKFDKYNNMVGPMVVRHVEKRDDGKLWNVVDETYDDVSQFWTYDAADYLKQPSYSQSFTGK
ncbi:ABC transporter substrate-binding protein [Parafrigoribacterium soli]|uniref:ABC transporter substrate-binding protein n=1 Tax=Parafrigoribacterium soli TaxID=3144663 RepID=UPI0032ED7B03